MRITTLTSVKALVEATMPLPADAANVFRVFVSVAITRSMNKLDVTEPSGSWNSHKVLAANCLRIEDLKHNANR